MTKVRDDLTGRKYGKLTVIRQAEDFVGNDGKHRTKWSCVCECGGKLDVLGCNLKRGNSQSCGCTRPESFKKHGGRYTRLYGIWTNMKTRCNDVNNSTYKNYGLRGITICDEWSSSFEAFRDWAMSHGYDDSLSIDRIDNNDGYYPENCRWVDARTQANNRRSSRYVTVDGVTRSLAEWSDLMGYSRSIFHARAIRYNTTVEDQVVKLVREYNRNHH